MLAATVSAAPAAHAQLVPHDRWYTVETPHFRIHFTRQLENEGRRAAVNAERAWAELSTELVAPRGKIDLVVADNVDYVNGYATSFPSNRIVIFAHPPIDAQDLRNYDDWIRLVVVHELVHVFHLDRAEGLWRAGRKLFGRHPTLFPNAFMPAWVVEGLAVYYESRITGAGRLEGSEHYMLSRAAAEVGRVPRINELSRATSRFPGGEVVYAYGGLIFDYLSRTRGPETVGRFVDVTSRVIVPFSLNRKARRAFGISFENAWRDWRDSLVRSSRPAEPLEGWRELTRDGRYAQFPRWMGDTAIVYAGATGREVTSAYMVSLDGEVRRLGRRNGIDVNVPLGDGSIIFAQLDYVDAFHLRSDLYREKDGEQVRLTRGARLTQPDVRRRDGTIIAVQSVPGSNVLARISPDGAIITPITRASDTVQWAEPRWSPDGSRIAAVKVTRGGLNEIMLLDESGGESGAIVAEQAVLASPSWSPAGDRVIYTSNRSGSSQAYSVAATGASRFAPLTAASTGFSGPELSPSASLLAGLHFRFDGYHVGVAPAPPTQESASEVPIISPRAGCAVCRLTSEIPPPLRLEDVGPARRYSPLRTLVPTYWEPLIDGSSDTGTSLGAATGGRDVIGRHSYFTQALYNLRHNEIDALAAYQYGGIGQPYVSFFASQEWEHFAILDRAFNQVGDLARRARTAGLSARFVRPRARTFASFGLGGDVESRAYAADPDTLLSRLPEVFSATRRYPSLFTSASWSNTKRPSLSISREDGMSLSATLRQRWESGDFKSASRSMVGVVAAYKSLDLPGFAHHVIAVRGAAGIADRRAISTFSTGGLSGGSLDVFTGFGLGQGGRTFGVRGFPPSAEQGIRAFAGTVEYRAPIAAPSRRVRFIPLLFDRISVAAFGEAGRAYCPAGAEGVCLGDRGGPWLASTGAEIDLDTAVQYDFPARFRLGFAVPVSGREAVGAKSLSVYFTAGSAF